MNTRAFNRLGPDTGYDSIGDFTMAASLARFLDRLEEQEKLTKTILYNINPRDNEMIAAMIALSNLGLLSRFVGMLTDSRSFLSYPRHEYFRRILCNLFGRDIENGEVPADFELVGETIKDICYRNAVNYFGIAPE